MGRFAQGKFEPKHPEKYVGRRTPTYRSSWEFAFMKFCDENPAIQAWASEAVKIPFRNPFTGRATIYVPDFFIQYKTKKGKLCIVMDYADGGDLQSRIKDKYKTKEKNGGQL